MAEKDGKRAERAAEGQEKQKGSTPPRAGDYKVLGADQERASKNPEEESGGEGDDYRSQGADQARTDRDVS